MLPGEESTTEHLTAIDMLSEIQRGRLHERGFLLQSVFRIIPRTNGSERTVGISVHGIQVCSHFFLLVQRAFDLRLELLNLFPTGSVRIFLQISRNLFQGGAIALLADV